MNKPGATRSSGGIGHESRLSRASVGRFSLYLRHLERLLKEGNTKVSSSQLGKDLDIKAAQVRKDFGCLGGMGQAGIGYPTLELIAALREKLGVHRPWSAVVVGIGNLARALLRYGGFPQQGFRFVGLFDADPAKVGQKVEGLEVLGPARMGEVIQAAAAELGIVTVPAEAAQAVADALVAAGIKGILNFAPVVLHLPAGVSLVAVDLAVQLEQLAFLVHLNETL